MSTLRLLGFTGEVPRVEPRLLPDGGAQEAFDTRLESGNLEPFRESRVVHAFPGPAPEGGYKTIYLHKEEWLGWNTLVHAAPGPVASDRLYITGDGVPKMKVAGTTYNLAVQRPAGALAGTPSGSATSTLNSTRIYVYTLVTDYDEETEPSPVSNEVNWFPGQAVTLSGFTATAPGRTIAKQRIYRSQTSGSGTDFFFIAERAASTADFVDNVPLESLQERLPSRDWNAPPDDLRGLISLPNGMMAAFSGKDLYFCEPWRPHAWPFKYVLTTDYNIVGLGAYGSTVVVTTEGNPYIASGSLPENMVMEKLELNLPCINPHGIQDLGYSVVYPSHEGLVTVSAGSASVATIALLSRDDWQRMLPATMKTGQYGGRYFGAYEYVNEYHNNMRGSIIVDFTGMQPFIIRSKVYPQAYYYDIHTGSLYFIDGLNISQWDHRNGVNALQYWKSKEFVLPRPTNFGAILVEARDALTDEELDAIRIEYEEARDANELLMDLPSIGGEIGGAALNVYPVNGDRLARIIEPNQKISTMIYADGKHVATVSSVNDMARLPSGFMARRWEVGVSSNVPITQVTLATTGAELAQV